VVTTLVMDKRPRRWAYHGAKKARVSGPQSSTVCNFCFSFDPSATSSSNDRHHEVTSRRTLRGLKLGVSVPSDLAHCNISTTHTVPKSTPLRSHRWFCRGEIIALAGTFTSRWVVVIVIRRTTWPQLQPEARLAASV